MTTNPMHHSRYRLVRLLLFVGCITAFTCPTYAQDVPPTTTHPANVQDSIAHPQLPQLHANDSIATITTSLIDSIIAEARKHLGKRYVHATAGPNTFDCSGFTSYVFSRFGYSLSRSSSHQHTQGKAVKRSDIQPGDLIFFQGRTAQRVGHVGLCISVDPERHSFKFIHAATSRGIVINDFATSGYYIRRYVAAKRIVGVLPRKMKNGHVVQPTQETPLPTDTIPSEHEGEKAATQNHNKAVHTNKTAR
ncbi:MAG: C40 family peptidase [Prevotellaceae bacterium]|nr:C40 family peptidase [Prevotellaceae bacterium]